MPYQVAGHRDSLPQEFSWRFALGFGAVVPLVSLHFRMQMHESESFEKAPPLQFAVLCRHITQTTPYPRFPHFLTKCLSVNDMGSGRRNRFLPNQALTDQFLR